MTNVLLDQPLIPRFHDLLREDEGGWDRDVTRGIARVAATGADAGAAASQVATCDAAAGTGCVAATGADAGAAASQVVTCEQ